MHSYLNYSTSSSDPEILADIWYAYERLVALGFDKHLMKIERFPYAVGKRQKERQTA